MNNIENEKDIPIETLAKEFPDIELDKFKSIGWSTVREFLAHLYIESEDDFTEKMRLYFNIDKERFDELVYFARSLVKKEDLDNIEHAQVKKYPVTGIPVEKPENPNSIDTD